MKRFFLLFMFLALSFTFTSAFSSNTEVEEIVIVDTINDLNLSLDLDSQSGLILNAEFEKPEKTCIIQANEKAISKEIEKRKALAQKFLDNNLNTHRELSLFYTYNNYSNSSYFGDILNTSSGGLSEVNKCNSIL